ncbi:hypothetical protein CEY12_17140 [Chryseobacterium sp. T16E-39]|uniref:hypothetical protein n=1 Tax=Chryseobacterium sp. T16E-39 TaxID=2015076 RepID=UPI000B5B295B|nr:hypothetical protein [Chryseobacterium sp. T16E-39]ASK31732.1 hypothetical protein CEY12_17140 [Chryseobacterium sp. T16E-39]
MMTSASKYLPTSTYFLQDKCTVKIGKEEYEALLSYTLYIETGENDDYDVSINRTNLKINDKKIDTKFLEISNTYMDALFPIHCKIDQYKLVIENTKEIQKRIKEADSKIYSIYSGEGIDHIRTHFFNATETKNGLIQFIKELHFMKIIEAGMQKFSNKKQYETSWKVLPIGTSQWKGQPQYQKEKNILFFEPKIDNAQEIMDDVIRYIHKHEYAVDFEEDNLPLYADFKHNINYTGTTGRIEKSETDVCIEVEDKFFYQHTITIQTK